MKSTRIMAVAAAVVAAGVATWLIVEENTATTPAKATSVAAQPVLTTAHGNQPIRLAQQQPDGTQLQTSEQQEEQQEQQQQQQQGQGGGGH